VRWTSERRWQFGAGIALRCVELGLDKKEAVAEVSGAEVSVPQICSNQIGHSQAGSPETSADEVRPSHAGALEIGAVQSGANEVGSRMVLFLARDAGSHEFAGAQQQGTNTAPVRVHVQFKESVSTAVRHTLGCLECELQLAVEGVRGPEAQRLAQIPEHFVELPHHREHVEHLPCGVRGLPPIPPTEGDLGHSLPGAEAVIHGAATETVPPEVFVDDAPEVRLQIRAGLPCGLVDREIG
jgi:hypothetical protein